MPEDVTRNNLFISSTEIIQPEWIDFNGHMNVAYYVLLFDRATDVFFNAIGITEEYRNLNKASSFAAELHVHYIQEVHVGDRVNLSTQLIDFDSKRIHYYHYMHHYDEAYLAATSDHLSLYIDMNRRKVDTMPEALISTLKQLKDTQAAIPLPGNLGSTIGIRR